MNRSIFGAAICAIAAISLTAALAQEAPEEPASGATAEAGEPEWRHGLSLLGEPKYEPDFELFDYVDPDAPKGGRLRMSSMGTFDTLNFVIPQGNPAMGIGFIYDTLMTPAEDESNTYYGLLAEAVTHPDDYSSVTYRLREEARWHDGEPVTPEDVIFSFETLKELNPSQGYYYRHVVGAEKTGEREVTFTFDQAGNRELPFIVGQLLIMPRHYWEGEDAQGRTRSISSATLEAPLSSGPYRVANVVAGRSITYERVEDYWGADLNVNIGKNNFDTIRYEYFRDETVQLEAFRADQYDFRVENSARNWALGYDFPARHDGRVVLEEFENNSFGIMQAWAFNTRLEKFQDPRVRLAFNYAMNFEEMNETIFYGQYERINSFFEGTELASSGLPEGPELEILEEVRGEVPEEVFTTPYENPVGGDQRAVRGNLREAGRLLDEAGWVVEGGRRVNQETGERLSVQFLLQSPSMERVALRYQQSLERLGIQVGVRTVDTSQYINRVRERNFEIISYSWPQSLSPGNEQLDFWGSDAAGHAASRNVVGIENPAVDRLIQRLIFARDRDELVAATHALDRVLLWNHYVVPHWTSPATRTARWNRFSYPEPLPDYSFGFPDIWWFDEQKAAGGPS